jgi:hypothetical protein
VRAIVAPAVQAGRSQVGRVAGAHHLAPRRTSADRAGRLRAPPAGLLQQRVVAAVACAGAGWLSILHSRPRGSRVCGVGAATPTAAAAILVSAGVIVTAVPVVIPQPGSVGLARTASASSAYADICGCGRRRLRPRACRLQRPAARTAAARAPGRHQLRGRVAGSTALGRGRVVWCVNRSCLLWLWRYRSPFVLQLQQLLLLRRRRLHSCANTALMLPRSCARTATGSIGTAKSRSSAHCALRVGRRLVQLLLQLPRSCILCYAGWQRGPT